MIQVTPHMRILLATDPADFRNGIDGLARLCSQQLQSDPFSGYVFVFRNKKATAIKILVYDGQGFWLCHKRLSQGRFKWWLQKEGDRYNLLAAHQLQMLIWNGDPKASKVTPMWKKIDVAM